MQIGKKDKSINGSIEATYSEQKLIITIKNVCFDGITIQNATITLTGSTTTVDNIKIDGKNYLPVYNIGVYLDGFDF